jgi:CIC family chloride channel protein
MALDSGNAPVGAPGGTALNGGVGEASPAPASAAPPVEPPPASPRAPARPGPEARSVGDDSGFVSGRFPSTDPDHPAWSARVRPTHDAPFRRLLARLSQNEDTQFLLVVALVGALGGLGAVGLRVALEHLTPLFFGTVVAARDIFIAGAEASPARRLAAPFTGAFLGGILLWVVQRRVPGGGAGMATIMEAVSIRHGVVSLRASLGRAGASLLTMAGGGSIGREGPIIAVAAAFASRVGRGARLTDERLRILVGAGAAAGFAAAYGTPVAATLFVLELVVGSFALEVLAPIALAAVVGTVVARVHLGEVSLYQMQVFEMRSPIELGAYFVLGLAAAAAGALFLEALRLAERLYQRLPGVVARTAVGGLVVGAIGLAGVPHVYGNGYEATSLVLKGGLVAPSFLAVIFVAKIAGTAATVGSGSPGGVFTPALLLGASLGAALGHAVHALLPSLTAPAEGYALVGMGALLAATTHAPLLSVVFVFEVSRHFDHSSAILLPLLLACIVASLAAQRIHPKSVYAEELERRGLQWEGSAEERVLRAIRVRDIMRDAPPILPPSLPVDEVVKTFLTTPVQMIYLGRTDAVGKELYGAIDFQSAKQAINDSSLAGVAIAADIASPVEPLRPDDSVVDASEKLWRASCEELPVVDRDRHLVGVVTRRDLLAAIDREVLRRNVLLAKVRWRGDEGTVTDFFELPKGQRLDQVPVPARYVGRTIADIDLRRKHGLNVLAILRLDEDGRLHRFAPKGRDRLALGDILVVIGRGQAVERFKALAAGDEDAAAPLDASEDGSRDEGA